MRIIFLVALAVLAQPAIGGSLNYSGAKALADRDEASLSKVMMQSLIDAQGALINRAISACVAAAAPSRSSPFVVVAKLGPQGKVDATWRQGDSAFAVCFERQVRGFLPFTPPHSPFYTSFEMNLKGTDLDRGHP
jgi:hypothetical protein